MTTEVPNTDWKYCPITLLPQDKVVNFTNRSILTGAEKEAPAIADCGIVSDDEIVYISQDLHTAAEFGIEPWAYMQLYLNGECFWDTSDNQKTCLTVTQYEDRQPIRVINLELFDIFEYLETHETSIKAVKGITKPLDNRLADELNYSQLESFYPELDNIYSCYYCPEVGLIGESLRIEHFNLVGIVEILSKLGINLVEPTIKTLDEIEDWLDMYQQGYGSYKDMVSDMVSRFSEGTLLGPT